MDSVALILHLGSFLTGALIGVKKDADPPGTQMGNFI